MIPESELVALKAVILRLEEAVPLSEVDLFYKTKLRNFRRMRFGEDPREYRAELSKHQPYPSLSIGEIRNGLFPA